jgi:CRISPR/Cas system-associated protein Cas10 (large subunit of type III CRISPR-Cas system)
MSYLLIAEADKIQSFIFQSSKLRQVVGASAMLERFGENVKKKPQEYLGVADGQAYEIISAGGGSFRIRFDNVEDVKTAKQLLWQKFTEEVGGRITLTYIEITNRQSEVKDGNDALRTAKTAGRAPVALWHLPYHALCQSSGSELASEFMTETNFADDTTEKYLGATTLQKGHFRNEKNPVLNKMLTILNDYAREESHDNQVNLPRKATDAETYAWDGRQYVAYLLADGNGMGEAFNACTPQQASAMSEAVSEITYKALAEAAFGLMSVQDQGNLEMPILPLIMGGDDVFALMPANWALDVAWRYVQNYQNTMTTFWEEQGIKAAIEKNRQAEGNDKGAVATLGVAIVICKSSYPYKSAHEFGDELLAQVKKQAKEQSQPSSMLGISWIVGSSVANAPDFAPITIAQSMELIEARKLLNDMPSRTREQLRNAVEKKDKTQQNKILERYNKLKSGEDFANLEQVVENLGDDFLMLVSLWDFLLDSRERESAYTLGARHVS